MVFSTRSDGHKEEEEWLLWKCCQLVNYTSHVDREEKVFTGYLSLVQSVAAAVYRLAKMKGKSYRFEGKKAEMRT